MADARLSVEIAADLRQAITAFSQAERVVEHGASTMATSANRAERAISSLGSTAPRAANAASAALANAGRAASSSGANFTALSRVIQDLPFGFIGIQNNITQLLPAAGGLGLAFSALISGLTFLQVGTSNWTRGLDDSKKAANDAMKATEDYADSLNQVAAANLTGAQNAAKEITELKILYSVTQNTNASFQQRIDAVNELQNKYPAYFKNISDEAILAGKAAGAYELLSQSIIATARARASEDLISANVKKQLENEQRIVEAQKEQQRIQKEAADLSRSSGGAYNPYGAGSTASVAAVLDAPRKIAEVQKDINNLKKENNDLDAKNIELVKNINVQIQKNADLAGKVGDMAKGKEDKTGSLFFPGITIKDLRLKEKYAEILKQITDGNNAVKLGIESAPLPNMNVYLDKLAEFQLAVHDILQNGIVTSFQDLGTGIGEALNNGANILAAAGQSFLGSIGGMMIQLGKLAIQTGIGIAAIKKALTSLNPVVAVAAGVALITLGTLVKGAAANIGSGGSGDIGGGAPPVIPQFANGTNFAPGGMSLVGERGPELVNLPRGSQVIPTHKLNSMGGGNVINLSGNLRMSMGELVFELDKERRRQSRQG